MGHPGSYVVNSEIREGPPEARWPGTEHTRNVTHLQHMLPGRPTLRRTRLLKRAYVARSVVDAHMLRQLLETQGIPATIRG